MIAAQDERTNLVGGNMGFYLLIVVGLLILGYPLAALLAALFFWLLFPVFVWWIACVKLYREFKRKSVGQ